MDVGPWDIPVLLQRALAAEEKARVEIERAERAEDLAVNGSERLRAIHAAAARTHRRIAARQVAAAEMHRSLARQIELHVAGNRADHLVDAVVEMCQAASVAMVVTATDGSPVGVLTSDAISSSAQQLEFVHGAGPLATARTTHHVVCAQSAEMEERWPQLGSALDAAGVRDVVAAPLELSEMSIGAICVYNAPERALSRTKVQRAADGVVQLMALADWPDEQLDLIDLVSTPGLRSLHQAAGVVAEELGCRPSLGLDLIRARAYAENESADAIAARVLRGDLHLTM